jgi:hypothetical protein
MANFIIPLYRNKFHTHTLTWQRHEVEAFIIGDFGFGLQCNAISAGYTWSNMDVYSSTCDAAWKMGIELLAKKNLSGVHVGVGYSF